MMVLGVCNRGAAAGEEKQTSFVRTQRVGDTVYFHVRFELPVDMKVAVLEAGPYSEGQKRMLAQTPRLVPQDGRAGAVYPRLDAPHFRPKVAFEQYDSPPIRGLEFVGKVRNKGQARLLLIYPQKEKPAKKGSALDRLLRPVEWRQVPVTLDLGGPDTLPLAERLNLEKLWAEAQAVHLAIGEALAPDFGFYGFACAATGRKYGVPDPVLEAEKRKDPERAHRRVFELATGTSAITQSLALRRYLNRDFRDTGRRTIDVGTVPGIELAEHPWVKMMDGKTPRPEPLAHLVPHDNYYLTFSDFRKFLEFGDFLEEWGTNLSRAWEGQSRDVDLKHRYERQLCLKSTWLGRTLGPLLIKGLAVTGSDPYLREGSDVAVIFHVNNRAAFLAGVDGFIQEARREFKGELKEAKDKFLGIAVESFVTPLREVSLHRAAFDEFVVYANSPVGLRRILEAYKGKSKALFDSLDFQYMRTVFRAGENGEDGFAFLSDAFIRKLVGPASKIKEKRRLEALTSLAMLTHGALFTAWETGRLPKDHAELMRACRLEPEHLYIPEGKQVRWDAGRRVAVSDAYNTLHFATPLVELPMDKITPTEEAAYKEFRTEYLRLWQQFFDPVGMRFSIDARQVKAETYILPLINVPAYRDLRSLAGGGTYNFDPGRLSAKSLLQFTFKLDRTWPLNDAVGHWAFIRLDDGPALARLGELWVMQDLAPIDADQFEKEQLAQAFKLPVTIGVEIGKNKEFRELLKGVGQFLNGRDTVNRKTWKYKNVTITRVKFGSNSFVVEQLNNLTNRRFSKLKIYHAEIDGGFYASLSKESVMDLIDQAARRKQERKKGEVVPINASLHLSPRAAVKARPAVEFFLEWETHKRALANNAFWQILHRANLIDGKTTEPARHALAWQFLGFVPVSPDDAAYEYDPAWGEVRNRRHGSYARPNFHRSLAANSPLARLLAQFPTARADMRFREDGLHAVLTVQRKSGK
jgi:hypothetical protein